MLRWTEGRDSYRVAYLPTAALVMFLIVAVGSAAAAVFYVRSGRVALAITPAVLALIIGIPISQAWRVARWIEIPLRGGVATWGRGAREEGRTATGVSHFDVEEVGGPFAVYQLVAVLADNSARAPITAWRLGPPAAFRTLVRQLNEHLGAAQDTPLRLDDLERRYGEWRWPYGMLALLIVTAVAALVFVLLFLGLS